MNPSESTGASRDDPRSAVVVKTYLEVWQAQFDMERLASAGIAAHVPDQFFQNMTGVPNTAIGGVRLVVAGEDLGRALSLLDEPVGRDIDAAIAAENVLSEKPDKRNQDAAPRCPACASDLIGDAGHSGGTILRSLLLLGLPLFFLRTDRLCRSCGHRWAPRREPASDGRPGGWHL